MTQQPFVSRARLSALLLLGVIAWGPLGCASNSTAERDAASARVSGQPPSADEDVAHRLPKGPDILTDASQQADAISGEVAGAGEASVKRDELKQFILKGPSFPLSMVEVDPARNGSEFLGYRVLFIAPAAQPTLDGRLKEGDIITHLNGVRVGTPDDYLNAWKLLADISTMRIDFVRDNEAHHSVWRVE